MCSMTKADLCRVIIWFMYQFSNVRNKVETQVIHSVANGPVIPRRVIQSTLQIRWLIHQTDPLLLWLEIREHVWQDRYYI